MIQFQVIGNDAIRPIIIIVIIVRLFLTRRNTTKTLQGRASTIRLTTVALSRQDSVTNSQTGKSSVRLWRSQSTGWRGCDAVGTSSASSCHVSVRQRMSMPWVVNRSLVTSTLFRSDRTLKVANLSCGSGRPTWRYRTAGSGLVETSLSTFSTVPRSYALFVTWCSFNSLYRPLKIFKNISVSLAAAAHCFYWRFL